MSASTRRAALGAILAAPLASVSAVSDQPSSLVAQCDWARRHIDWVNSSALAEHWPDDRLDDEAEAYFDAFDEAMATPAADAKEVGAKARLLLGQLCDHGADRVDCINMRSTVTVLREVIALCA